MVSLKLLAGMLVFSVLLALFLRFAGIKWRIHRTVFIISIIISFLGILLAIFQEDELAYYNEIKGWPTTTATVVETGMTGERAILPEIRYTYRVNDSLYTERTDLNIPGFGNRKRRQQTARIIIADYPPGKELIIHYNPENPANSKLRISPPWNLFGKLGFGTFLFGTGIFIIVFYFVPVKKRE